jgi:hypothetical protein
MKIDERLLRTVCVLPIIALLRVLARARHFVLLLAMSTGAIAGCSSDNPSGGPLGTTTQDDNVTTQRAVNCGGGAAGSFVVDQGYNGGASGTTSALVSTTGVAEAAPEAVYQSQRYGDFTYVFASLTPGATYTVRIHFAEIYFTAAGSAGKRVFNVLLNDKVVLAAYDIYADVGALKAVVKTFSVQADSRGKIRIYFESLVDNAATSGIEVVATSSRSDAGGPDATTTHSVVLEWVASTAPGVTYDVLRGTVSGGPYTQIQSGIASTATTDTNVTAGATYYYVARSQDLGGQSVNSNEVKAVIP